jgi:hypothetical protein
METLYIRRPLFASQKKRLKFSREYWTFSGSWSQRFMSAFEDRELSVAKSIEALCCKPEGRGFETWWDEWFSIYLIFLTALGPGIYSACNRNEYGRQTMFLGCKFRPPLTGIAVLLRYRWCSYLTGDRASVRRIAVLLIYRWCSYLTGDRASVRRIALLLMCRWCSYRIGNTFWPPRSVT